MSSVSAATYEKYPIYKLSDLCEVNIGRTPSRSKASFWNGDVNWLSIADMNQGRIIKETSEKITRLALQEANCKIIEVGTVLLSFKLSIGKVAINQIPVVTNEAIAALPIKNNDLICNEFLFWLLKSSDLTKGLDRAAKGLTLNKAKLLELKFRLPPLGEQKRIAAILDKADALRAKRREAIEKVNSLSQAIFLEMFGDPETNEKNFEVVRFENIVAETKLGLVRSASLIDKSYPHKYIKMDAIGRAGEFLVDKVVATNATNEELRNFSVKFGDFLFNTRNSKELVGKTTIFPLGEPMLFNNNIMRIRFSSNADSFFVQELFKTAQIQRELENRKSGTTNVFAVYYKDLATLPIILPPLQSQIDFRKRIEQIVKAMNFQKKSLKMSDSLFAALQSRLFGLDLGE